MIIIEKVDKLIELFNGPQKALLHVTLLLDELPNTLLEEQKTYNFYKEVQDRLIKLLSYHGINV